MRISTQKEPNEAPLICIEGGSALMAIDVLLGKGVPEERIIFINLIASPEGAERFSKQYPKIRIVTAFVDQGLNEKKYGSNAPFEIAPC